MIRALALALAFALPAAAQDTDTVLTARRAAQALARAAVALDEAEGARDRVAALTATVRAYEEGLTALRDGLRRASIREEAIRLRFEAKRADVAALTGALTAIERTPEPLLTLHPSGPLGAVRSGLLMADLTPALQAEAEVLRAELEELSLLRSLQEGAAAQLAQGLEEAQTARLALSQAISERTALPRRFADDPEALAALIAGADTLESFAAGLTAVPLEGADPAGRPFAEGRGSLPLPVQGVPLRAFGEADAAGVSRPGLVLATRPLALVTAPAPATVRYAGPLLDYGNVIVLEPAAGYLLVLAGLGELYVARDEVVAADAPLGLMGGGLAGTGDPANGTVQGGGAGRTETLYMELREGGAPVDPEPWFAPQRG